MTTTAQYEKTAFASRRGDTPHMDGGSEGAKYRQLAQHAVTRLGEVLVERGVISDEDLNRALTEQQREARAGHWVLLGELLDGWGLTTPEDVDAALWEQVAENEPHLFPRAPHPSVDSRLKRVIDIVGALVGLGFTAALLPLVALAIVIEDRGPVFFQQHRVGRHGYQFGIWKFRTMVTGADHLKLSVENTDPLFFKPRGRDPRITRVGQVLRKTLIDELPQFWNVLRGDMSLVGTRPPTLDEVARYTLRHWKRLEVKPGMTGLWQISGQRHMKNFSEVVSLDLDYQRRWSHWLDLTILVRTLGRALGKVGSL